MDKTSCTFIPPHQDNMLADELTLVSTFSQLVEEGIGGKQEQLKQKKSRKTNITYVLTMFHTHTWF